MNTSKPNSSRSKTRVPESERPVDALKRYGFIQSKKFAELDCEHDWLIEGILIKGQAGVIGGPAKCLKTGVVIDMALSLGSGKPFLGEFNVPTACRVAVMSGESGKSSLQDTAKRVCKSKKTSLEEISNVHWAFTLPNLTDEEDLSKLSNFLEFRKIKVVFIDPLYLCLCGGSKVVSPSNLYEVGPILGRITETCLKAGATPIIVHHSTKGTAKPSEDSPITLNDLAFAGVTEFFRQWVLLNKREEYSQADGFHQIRMSVGGSAGQSGCWNVDVREGVLDKNFRGRRWDVQVRDGLVPEGEEVF
ncbi:AAA family ATPase [uncultured Gimesia sp.]|uniref:AAA family ATPase n=1 Tax=uncultured Gimesia sp. TaxID=1678688 RepID=UPI0030D7B95E